MEKSWREGPTCTAQVSTASAPWEWEIRWESKDVSRAQQRSIYQGRTRTPFTTNTMLRQEGGCETEVQVKRKERMRSHRTYVIPIHWVAFSPPGGQIKLLLANWGYEAGGSEARLDGCYCLWQIQMHHLLQATLEQKQVSFMWGSPLCVVGSVDPNNNTASSNERSGLFKAWRKWLNIIMGEGEVGETQSREIKMNH